MASKITELRGRATELARHPRTKKIAIWFVSVMAAIGVIGALVAPPLLRRVLANQLTTKLHRQVSIEQIRINPYAMSATVRGFTMKERQSPATAVSFDELYVNLELQSLFRWGLVVKALHLVKPYVNLVRNEDRTYNYKDLIDEFMSGPSGPTPRFSVNNIQIIDGKIDFDDRPEQTKHTVSAINIGVPFISSLPSQVDIEVQPHFSALINGAPLVIGGESKPFKDSRESTVQVNIDKLEIPKYLEYSPVALNFKVPSGQINGKLTAAFKTFKDKPSLLAISGNVAVRDLVMQEKGESPLLNLPSLDVIIDAFEVLASKATVKTVKLQAPELHVTRNRDGTINLTSLIAPSKAETAPQEKKNETPFAYRVDDIMIDQGKLVFIDQGPEHPFQKQLENIHISLKGLTNEAQKKAETEISFQTEGKEQFSHSGTLQLTPLLADGKIEVKNMQLNGLRPYYESVIGVEIKEGRLDLTTHFTFEQKQELDARLADVNAELRSLRLDVPGESEPLWRIPLLAIKDTTVDVGKKTVVIGSFESRDGNGFIDRDQDGTISYARLIKAQTSNAQTKQPDQQGAAWRVETKRIALDRFKVNFDDRTSAKPAKLTLSELSVRGENFSNAKNQRGKATIQTRINNKGSLKLTGTASLDPVGANFAVEGRDIELLPFQPYLENQVNFVLTGGQVGTKGTLVFDGTGPGPAKMSYEGNAQIADFATIEKDGAADLLKWKSLALDGIRFASAPMNLRLNEITLAGFYSHLVIGPDGKFNLQKLTVDNSDNKPKPTGEAASPEKAPEKTDTTASAANSETGAKTAQAQPPTDSPPSEKPISIGNIKLQDGEILFNDFFIKPNYSAHLNSVQGAISELKPETPGDLVLDAKLDDAAPVDIRGKINPLTKDLYLDIAANAKDIELSRFSPYSTKYVGYGIQSGKLSFNVKYKVENRKLTAENQIILNQLTFGERVESPTAIKAPVLLAVALLKDRNGVIDVNLPIGGSLDDPQFSVGGIVLRVFINIITRAITAPFTLLGSLFSSGGGTSGEELSYIEFDYGRAALSQAAEAKIKTLATAMNNRPALKLDISGQVDPVNDLEGLKKSIIERKMKALKMKELARQGTAPASVDEVQIASGEYERYLKEVYGDESFSKPRNIVGLAKDLPAPEMESLLLKNTRVTEDDLHELANRRAQAVRDRILGSGQVTADRLSIVGAKPTSGEEKDKAKAKMSRVDFALR
ncbi:MAG TPA: DUF748 domain-containing protein [Candidatus Acidoferrales bacterium]|nr:DUF748 domain-containing protein [Candidatus Acidoferrales bacterium]